MLLIQMQYTTFTCLGDDYMIINYIILYIEIIPVKSKSYMGHMDGEGFGCLSSQIVNP